MNIVYISHLSMIKSEGPNVSVPAQVEAQAKIDNVFWYNLTQAIQEHWLGTGCFHGISEYPSKKIDDLPSPFNTPDLVIFESFYYIDDVKIARWCRKKKIPYIVIPRSALTQKGQNQKRYKKIPANILLFKPMTKGAAAIQYLTKAELDDSGMSWNKKFIVIPNGVYPAVETKTWTQTSLHGVYIGRFDPYQKGLDLLIEACETIKSELLEAGVQIDLHGPERLGWQEKIRNEVREKGLNKIIFVKDGVFGEEKKRVLLNADFFLMTSRFEGHPMSMIEALSYGLPVFATKGTNMTDEIKKYNAGWTCDNTVDSIVNGLKILIISKNGLEELSKNALRLSYNYNWDRLAKESHDEYIRLIRSF